MVSTINTDAIVLSFECGNLILKFNLDSLACIENGLGKWFGSWSDKYVISCRGCSNMPRYVSMSIEDD